MFTDLKIHSKYCRIRQGKKEPDLGLVRDKIAVFIYLFFLWLNGADLDILKHIFLKIASR